jgi:hypothetical protein
MRREQVVARDILDVEKLAFRRDLRHFMAPMKVLPERKFPAVGPTSQCASHGISALRWRQACVG